MTSNTLNVSFSKQTIRSGFDKSYPLDYLNVNTLNNFGGKINFGGGLIKSFNETTVENSNIVNTPIQPAINNNIAYKSFNFGF